MKLIFSIAFSLFLLIDSIGNVPIFLSCLKSFPPKRQTIIIFREQIISLFVIFLFMFLGQPLLDFLRIQHSTVFFSGGIILFIIALKMIFPPRNAHDISRSKEEPFIVPLAIPLSAGPATMAAVILYAAQVPTLWHLFFAILIAWLASSVILLSSSLLSKLLGTRGMTACERLMGLILTLIAVQMFLNGIQVCFQR
ncbi:MAG: hypothetical protein A2Y28_00200 [Chlamydiae bacterium GWC2_50_10]|nr:MAG: hypothetical protein A2Z85_03765 [Chlamydiae bacterium GWA2_50_15]OGN54577.1 MAG: hypothetical protein A2Y28_00200 [Chlamydiae bacterium GWC2_50_10]OGN55782.1 MAG: hypothetical protein A2098_04350 [Chlamydiae bacterium GWF2_49_8]OGN58539.1 MAG: hypothetical protein A3D18_04555 [Chlamydiae bacterium RIFCSPHIGHO2_02_FULL_49_29]OGN63118.1 MAG: hypothetical protein A3E26_05005 [Chlamydiae bacterium RIFCSPHIGHO2_12_FULL_49_32]OGN71600.1 MAG: hypothetical protein A3I15_04920 [Chlamydiae bact